MKRKRTIYKNGKKNTVEFFDDNKTAKEPEKVITKDGSKSKKVGGS